MVKCDSNIVEIHGNKFTVMAEATALLHYLRKCMSKDEFDRIVKDSEKTESEIQAETMKAKKELEKIVKTLFGEEDE